MIRNAVDHGIESSENRLEAGKPAFGTITLKAAHRSGNVNIEIKDDGAGLNREKIYEIALKKRLIKEDTELSDSEIDNLLFLPGFSTASEISNLSGRGVGMDVVKNAVAALGGRVSISSVPGEGTTFMIVLPLTLAVMDGMVISVAGQTMVAPISSIVESIRPEKGAVENMGTRERLLSIRGNYVPIIEVAEHLGLINEINNDPNEVLLLVETEQSGQCALAVDAIHDQRQVVVKSLSSACGNVPGVSAATILGDGKIAMIIDTESITQSLVANKAVSPKMTNQEEAAKNAS
jgi:two-component system chemotaxis sensor kinase CheA